MLTLCYIVMLALGIWMMRRAQYRENLATAALTFWPGLLGAVVSAWKLLALIF